MSLVALPEDKEEKKEGDQSCKESCCSLRWLCDPCNQNVPSMRSYAEQRSDHQTNSNPYVTSIFRFVIICGTDFLHIILVIASKNYIKARDSADWTRLFQATLPQRVVAAAVTFVYCAA